MFLLHDGAQCAFTLQSTWRHRFEAKVQIHLPESRGMCIKESSVAPPFPIAVWMSLLLLLRRAEGQPFLRPWHWDAMQGSSWWSRLWLLAWQALQAACTEAGVWRGALLVWEGIEEFWLVVLASCGVLCCFFFFKHRIRFGFEAVMELQHSSVLGGQWVLRWWWSGLCLSGACAGCLLWGGFGPLGSCLSLLDGAV